MDFLAQTAYQPLPLYKANKHAKQLHPSTTEKNAWKFEEFIFDLFQYSEHSQAIVYPRHECFAPLKTMKGTTALQRFEKLCAKENMLYLLLLRKENFLQIQYLN